MLRVSLDQIYKDPIRTVWHVLVQIWVNDRCHEVRWILADNGMYAPTPERVDSWLALERYLRLYRAAR